MASCAHGGASSHLPQGRRAKRALRVVGQSEPVRAIRREWLRNMDRYWPGSRYVDLVGSTMINWGGQGVQRARLYATFKTLRAEFGKPVVLTETNTAHRGRVRWLHDLRRMLARAKWIRAVVWSQLPSRGKVQRGNQVGETNWDVTQDPAAAAVAAPDHPGRVGGSANGRCGLCVRAGAPRPHASPRRRRHDHRPGAGEHRPARGPDRLPPSCASLAERPPGRGAAGRGRRLEPRHLGRRPRSARARGAARRCAPAARRSGAGGRAPPKRGRGRPHDRRAPGCIACPHAVRRAGPARTGGRLASAHAPDFARATR